MHLLNIVSCLLLFYKPNDLYLAEGILLTGDNPPTADTTGMLIRISLLTVAFAIGCVYGYYERKRKRKEREIWINELKTCYDDPKMPPRACEIWEEELGIYVRPDLVSPDDPVGKSIK